jgi:protein-disulfide isomerase
MPTVAQPTRKELRDAARRARAEREAAIAAAALRRRRLTRLGAVLAAAAVAVAVLVAISGSGSGSGSSAAKTAPPAASSGSVAGAHASTALLAGIPQRGLTLGKANAPVRVVEFADLQCPFCRDYALNTMPRLVRDYVRPGTVRMEFRSLAFIGPDSVRAARVAQAAAEQNKLWSFVDLAYANQGKENSGWATDAFLRRLASAVPGLDVNRAFAARGSAAVTGRLKAANTLATSAGVNSTPTFLVGRGSALKAVDAAGLPAAIKAAVGR